MAGALAPRPPSGSFLKSNVFFERIDVPFTPSKLSLDCPQLGSCFGDDPGGRPVSLTEFAEPSLKLRLSPFELIERKLTEIRVGCQQYLALPVFEELDFILDLEFLSFQGADDVGVGSRAFQLFMESSFELLMPAPQALNCFRSRLQCFF